MFQSLNRLLMSRMGPILTGAAVGIHTTSRMNVTRFADSKGWAVEAEDLPDGGFRVILKK